MYSTDRGRSKKPLAEAVEHEAQADRDTGLALARTMLAVGFLDFADRLSRFEHAGARVRETRAPRHEGDAD